MMVTPSRLAIFTICSNNYMASAHVLLESARRHHPCADLFVCLADRRIEGPGFYGSDWMVIEAHSLDIPDFPSFAFRYDIMEFNTAVKPFMFQHLVGPRGYDAVLYFDPDIELFAPLNGVLATLQAGASFVLTPHLCSPSEGRQEPNDLSIMRAGAYNLGFLGVSRTAETLDILAWWARRLRFQCISAQTEGIFVDQKFMDLVPGFAARAAISHDTTLNVAYWNLWQRRLEQTEAGWLVDGTPLTFFHFSGFDPRNPSRLSKYDRRFNSDMPAPLRTLAAQYVARLADRGYATIAAIPYAYASFASGTVIHPTMRKMFRDWQPSWVADPFETFEAFLHAAWPDAARGPAGQTVTNLMAFLWQATPLLRARLDLRRPLDAAELVRWFVTTGAGELGLGRARIEA